MGAYGAWFTGIQAVNGIAREAGAQYHCWSGPLLEWPLLEWPLLEWPCWSGPGGQGAEGGLGPMIRWRREASVMLDHRGGHGK